MDIENRKIIYDDDLDSEAYHFEGIIQAFPAHFHDYYVTGYTESGKRQLSVNQQDYRLETGDTLLLNPLDTHACETLENYQLNYRALNLKTEVLQKAVYEITGSYELPIFQHSIVKNEQLGELLRDVHIAIFQKKSSFEKEECFYFFIKQLLSASNLTLSPIQANEAPTSPEKMKHVLAFIKEHYAETIHLEDLSTIADLSKYHFLRNFTKSQNLTPFQYIQTVRIQAAIHLLKKGIPLVEVAGLTGFHDQSHFSNTFKKCIGLTPKQYQNIFKLS